MVRAEVNKEIEEVFGFVPSFFKPLPDSRLELEWRLFQRLECEEGAIPKKYRQLIGVAIAAVTKSPYCAFYHRASARLNDITDTEVEAAAHVAKLTNGWSTYLSGLQVDMDEYRREVHQAGDRIRTVLSKSSTPVKIGTRPLATRDEVLREVQDTLGFIPTVLKRVPEKTLTLEWELLKQEIAGDSPIPIKYRALIGVAVGGLISCPCASVLHTEMARVYGATQVEIEEAVAYAKLATGWTTYVQGLQLDFDVFKDEVVRACEHMLGRKGEKCR